MSDLEKIRILPLLPLKNSVLFPGLLMPLSVGRTSSLAAVEAAVATEDKEIIVVAQRDASADTPGSGGSVHDRHPRGDPQSRTAQGRPHRHPGVRAGARGDREGTRRGRAPFGALSSAAGA